MAGEARRALLWMLLVALGVRLFAMSLDYRDRLNPARDHWAFGYEMGRIARSLASGQGYSSPFQVPTGPSAFLPPAYPFLLAGVFKLFGIYTKASALVILTLNNLFSALTCLPLFFYGRRAYGEGVALAAGWAWALFPYAVYVPNRWIWETSLTTLLLGLLLWLTLRLKSALSRRAWLEYGLLAGLAALSNPVVLSVVPFLAGWIWFRQEQGGAELARRIAIAALGFLLVVTPWFVRNYVAFRQPIFFRDSFGLVLYAGNNADTSKPVTFRAFPAENPSDMERIQRIGEPAFMAEKEGEAWAFIVNHPREFAWRTLRRMVCFWTGFWSYPPSRQEEEDFQTLFVIGRTALTLLALWGLRRAITDRREYTVPLVLLAGLFPLVYYFTYPYQRFAHPLDPFLILLAAYGIFGIFARHPQPTPGASEQSG